MVLFDQTSVRIAANGASWIVCSELVQAGLLAALGVVVSRPFSFWHRKFLSIQKSVDFEVGVATGVGAAKQDVWASFEEVLLSRGVSHAHAFKGSKGGEVI